jgi:cytochrome c oxidase subunit 2
MGLLQSARILAAAATGSLAVALLAPAAVWADALTPESGGSPNADAIDSLYKLVLYVACAVFVAVEGTLVYSLVRFKAGRGRVAAQIHGNTRLEIGWTVGAVLILVVLTVITFVKVGTIVNPAPAGSVSASVGPNASVMAAVGQPPPGTRALRIEVSGQQYIWRFRYPSGVFAYEELVVPADTTVLLNIVSQDVAHSWWIPKLGGKADAIPGYTNHTWFRISKPGVFRGQCAELCGRNHGDMTAHVRAVSPARFRVWLAAQRRDIAEARSGAHSTPAGP